jgi:methionine-rich copper-binding protein CopC
MIIGRVNYTPWLSTPITLTSIDPTNMTLNVADNKVIKIVFNEPIEVDSQLIQLKDNENNIIPLNISINGNILYLNPTSLSNNTKYNLTLSNGSIKDLAGYSIQAYTTNFSTGPIPIITSINPLNGELDVASNKNITITFNEPIQNGNMWIELQNSNGTSTPFTTSIQGNILTIIPSTLTNHTKYTLLLHTGCIKDLSGQNLVCNTFNFSTGPLPVITSIKLINNNVIQLKFNVTIKTGSMSIEVLNSHGMAVATTNTIKDGYLNLSLHKYHYIYYVDPNETPYYNVNTMKKAGITDVFILVSRSPSANNYYKTYLPKIIPKFRAAGITLHAWIFPDFTTQDVARIAAMGVNIHLDLEFGYYPSTEYLTSYVSNIRAACKGKIFTVAVDPNAPGVYSGPIRGEDYSLIAPHVDAIMPMLYNGDFDLSDTDMRSAVEYLQKQAPGKLWITLESYISDINPIPKSSNRILVEINDVKAYSNGLASYRYGLSNFEEVIKTITSGQNRYTIILHSNSITDLEGNPIKLKTLIT